MSTHYVELGSDRLGDLRLYFDVGTRSGVATATEEGKEFLQEYELNLGFDNEIPIGIQRASELILKVNINKFLGNKQDLFKGYDTTTTTGYGNLTRWNRYWIARDTGLGYDWNDADILFEGVQEVRSEDEVSDTVEITATCHIKRFMEWVGLSYLIGSHSYGITPTNGTSGNPSYTRELRDFAYKDGSSYYVVRSSRFLSGRVSNPVGWSGAVLYRTEDYINFLLNSSQAKYDSGAISPYYRWNVYIRGALNPEIDIHHTPFSHYTFYEGHDTSKEYNTLTSNVMSAGSTQLNPETEIYIPMGEVVGSQSFPNTVCSTGYHSERDSSGTLWDWFKLICEGYGTKALVTYGKKPKISFHPILDYMDTSSTYASKVYKSVNTITSWLESKLIYHGNYISRAEVQLDDVYIYGFDSAQTTLSDYLTTISNASINSTAFDTIIPFNNIPSDVAYNVWKGLPFEWIYTNYESTEYKDKAEVVPPNRVNKLYSQTSPTLSITEDNRAVQYLMVHPHTKFEVKQGTEYSAISDIYLYGSEYLVQAQNKAFELARQENGLGVAYAKALMGEFGKDTRFKLEMTLDDSQVNPSQLGEKFEISGGIDQIIGSASWLSGVLTNVLILVDITCKRKSINDKFIYECIFTGA